MAGHSKWKNIQHRKGAVDAKRGKIFSKLVKEITVAVKVGGPDPDSNPRLRTAIQNAKGQSMPKDNIERAINKGVGGDGADMVEPTFEGYGPEGVAIFVETATDNNTRTVANVRSAFNKFGGNLGKDGCLQFIFSRQAVFTIAEGDVGDEDEFQLELIDVGAEEIESDDGYITVYGAMEDFNNISTKLTELGIEPKEGGLQRIPSSTQVVSPKGFQTLMKLIERLEDDDDVQKVYHNVEFSEDLVASVK